MIVHSVEKHIHVDFWKSKTVDLKCLSLTFNLVTMSFELMSFDETLSAKPICL